MLLPFFSIARWSKQILITWICAIRFGIFAISFASFVSAEDSSESLFSTFSVDWNGSVFLISGTALNSQPFPSLTLYENNFYKFEHNGSAGFRLNIGEDNSSTYVDSDVWNNGALSPNEYLFFQPDMNTSRTLYYFNPESNSSVGQIGILSHESNLYFPTVSNPSAKFGKSIAINEWNQTIVGAPGEAGFDDGEMHIFNREANGTYSYFEKVSPPISGLSAQFAHSIESVDNYLFVGSPDVVNYSGVVDVFKRENNGSYSFDSNLSISIDSGDSFGWSLSGDSNYLAIGSLQTINNGGGEVSIFENNGTNWNFSQTLFAVDENNQSGDEFGYDLKVDNSRLIVGAPKVDANGTNSGSAYIYERNSTGWYQTAILSPSGPSAEDEFGYAVALSDNLAFVGARQKDGNATDAGVVYVFHFDGAVWTEVYQIYPPTDMANQYFSSDLEVHDDILAVSSPRIGEGSIYIYRFENNGSKISYLSNLSLSETNSSDQSFLSLSVQKGGVFVGVPGDSTKANSSGTIVVFQNDAWQEKFLPEVAPIIESNSSIDHQMSEDNGTYYYDFNGSHPIDSNLSWSITQFPDSNATYDLNSTTGEFSYTPEADFFGIHSFSIQLSNGILSDSLDFNMTVHSVEDAPVFDGPFNLIAGMEGDEYNQTIAVRDVDGDLLTLGYFSSPSFGLNTSGYNLFGTPNSGSANGLPYQDYNVTLSLDDAKSATVYQSFSIRILKRNNPPVIWVDGNSSLNTYNINLSEDFDSNAWYASLPHLDYNDSDGHQIDLNVSINPSFGNLSWDIKAADLNQSITYSPHENFNGIDSFTMILRDLEGEGNKSHELTFNLSVAAVNDAPDITSAPPMSIVQEGDLFSYQIVVTDPDLFDAGSTEQLSVTVENLPPSGWLEFNSTTNLLSGTPQWSDYEEGPPRLIVIKVQDSAGLEDTQAFTLEVRPHNYPPVITQGASFSATLDEDTSINSWGGLDLSVSGLDQVQGVLNWEIFQQGINGRASVTGSGTTPPSLTYQPDGNFSGTDHFILRVFESLDPNASDTIRIDLNVLPLADDPAFSSLTSGIAIQDFLFDYNITALDADADSNLTISSLVLLPDWLTLTDYGNGTARLTGTPDQYDLGSKVVVLEVRDETNRFAVQAFMLVVLDQNTNPIINQGDSITFSHTEDQIWRGNSLLSANDSDGQFLNWSLKSVPSHGTVNISGQGSSPSIFEYIPDSNFSGLETFEVSVSDGIGTDFISVSINVQNVNDSPVFTIPPSDQVTIDNQTFILSPKVFDADGLSNANAVITGDSWLGISSFDRTSGIIQLSGVPSESDEGNSTFSLLVTDSTGLSISASFKVQVRVLNYAPSINGGLEFVSVTMMEDNITTWVEPNLIGSDTETSANNLVWSVFTNPSHGTLNLSGAGPSPQNFDYSPDGNFSGSDSFVVQVTDTGGIESSPPKYDTIIVKVEVTPVNDPPAFTSIPTTDRNDSYSWNDESVYVYEIKTFDADCNYSWHSLDLNVTSTLPDWLSFRNDGNGTGVLYGLSSVADEGNHTITLHAFDSNQTFANQSFVLQVRIDNYPPVFESVTNPSEIIKELVVYVDEDTNPMSPVRGWIPPTYYRAVDPDANVQTNSQTLSWSLGSEAVSGASISVSGLGERPTQFSYSTFKDFFGDDTFSLNVNDGWRDAKLPVRVKVRGVPDVPYFTTSFSSLPVAKEGAQFNFEISTADPDNSPRTIKVFGLPSEGESWLKLVDMNSTSGTARLSGVPPSQSSGKKHDLAFVVSDETGLFSVANGQLVVDGKNTRPVINIGEKAVVRFNRNGNANPKDIALLYATDIEGEKLEWSLSSGFAPKYGTVSVTGLGTSTPSLLYFPFSDIQEDTFKIQVSDGVSFDQVEINAKVLDTFDTFAVSEPTVVHLSQGEELSDFFKVSNYSGSQIISGYLRGSPSWLELTKTGNDVFHLHGIVPLNASSNIPIKIQFLEDGENRASKEYSLSITDSYPPSLNLLGDHFMQLAVGKSYLEPGYQSIDQDGTNLSSSVSVTGSVNENQVGVYELIYRSQDSSGNQSEKKRKVQVIDINNTVNLATPVPILSSEIKDFKPLDYGLVVAEQFSETESRIAQYSDYGLGTIEQSFTYKAGFVKIEHIEKLKGGNYLICGVFRGNLEFGPHLVVPKGSYNAFAMKLDSQFQKVWFSTISASSNLKNLTAFQSSDLSVRVVGDFAGTLKAETNTLDSAGKSDNFLWHLGQGGEFKSVLSFGDKEEEEIVSVKELGSDFFIMASNTTTANGLVNSTIIKFNSQNIVVSGQTFKSAYFNRVLELVTHENTIYLAGDFENELKIGDKRITSNSSRDGFLCALSESLSTKWITLISSSDSTSVDKVKIDPFGHPIIISSYSGSFVEPSGLSIYSSSGQTDLLIAKLDQLNGSLIWGKSFGTGGEDSLLGFEVDSFGRMNIHASMNTPFTWNGVTQTQGNHFFISVNSMAGIPVFDNFSDLELIEGEFFNKQINILNQPIVRFKILTAPSWLTLYDNLNGSCLIGGIPNLNESSSGRVSLRAYNGEGSTADLDFNYTISPVSTVYGEKSLIPSISSVTNLGQGVLISAVSSSYNGNYIIGGSFESSLELGTDTFSSVGNSNGFISQVGINGKSIRSIQLIGAGELSVGGIQSSADGDHYIFGEFTSEMRVGTYEISSMGGRDLFILQWGKNGELKNLSAVGGSSDEYFSAGLLFENSLYLTGEFEETFSYGSKSVSSKGAKDGFVMQLPLVDPSIVNWFLGFGGSKNEKVNSICVSPKGKLYLGGSFSSSATFGAESLNSLGLQDCFVAEIDSSGNFQNLYHAGGTGMDEISSLLSIGNQLLISGNFQNTFQWGNRKVKSKGKQDGFIAKLSESGNCISLRSYGGIGNDSIQSLLLEAGGVSMIGNFDNSISLGDNSFFTRGKRDGFLAKFSDLTDQITDVYHLGGAGEDILTCITNLMDGHMLLSGVIKGQLSSTGEVLSSLTSSETTFFSILGHTTFSPSLYPKPERSILTSKMYEFEFTTGPWPKGSELSLQVIQKPSWLNIELFDDGKGLVWGRSPSVAGVAEKIYFAITSNLSTNTLFAEWDLQVRDNSTIFSIIGQPVLSATQFAKYNSQFSLLDSSPEKILVIPQKMPEWMKLERMSESTFQLEGTPGIHDLGSFPVEILVSKLIDNDTIHQEILEYSIRIRPKILEEATFTNLAQWQTSWFGYFESFENLWTYHQDFGWIYLGTGNQADGIWYWTEKWGWFWTNSSNWDSSNGTGYLFNTLLNEWTYFRRKDDALPAALHIYSTAKWYSYE